MVAVTDKTLREETDRVLESVERTSQPVIITKSGRPVAVLICIDEWEELEAFRDRCDTEAIVRSRARGQFIPLSDALELLGVKPGDLEAVSELGESSGSA